MSLILSEVNYDYGGEYRFVLTSDLVVYLNKGIEGYHELVSDEIVRAVIKKDKLTILSGYAFDGASPAWRIFGTWYGTPTPRPVVPAAAVHDCLRQFMGLKCLGYSRKDTDDIFYSIMEEQGFLAGGIYHEAVAGIVGTLFMKLTWRKSNCYCRNHAKRA